MGRRAARERAPAAQGHRPKHIGRHPEQVRLIGDAKPAATAPTARSLLRRTTALADLRAHAASGELSGLDKLLFEGEATPPPWGAVVLALPSSATRPHLAVAGLLTESGLVLLASDEVIERYQLMVVA